MKIRILGCGGSGGVPLIGNQWGVCDPKNPKNRRSRTSILVEADGKRILVDTGPDLRQQLLAANVADIDAVIYTHEHADHIHGIDDLRPIFWRRGQKPIPIYANAPTMDLIRTRFPYLFEIEAQARHLYRPFLEPRDIDVIDGSAHDIAGVPVRIFQQDHVACRTLGLRFGDFTYSTDVKYLDDTAWAALEGTRVWVVGGVQIKPHPTHANKEEALAWIERLRPEQAYLTHLGQHMDYDTEMADLPDDVALCYDGLEITL